MHGCTSAESSKHGHQLSGRLCMALHGMEKVALLCWVDGGGAEDIVQIL